MLTPTVWAFHNLPAPVPTAIVLAPLGTLFRQRGKSRGPKRKSAHSTLNGLKEVGHCGLSTKTERSKLHRTPTCRAVEVKVTREGRVRLEEISSGSLRRLEGRVPAFICRVKLKGSWLFGYPKAGAKMARCAYCGDRAGFWARICRDCKKLLARVQELRGQVGYGEFLDGLESTGVSKEKIMLFLKADPDGQGCIQDQVTAEMTTELMKVMGLRGSQTPQAVKRIRQTIGKESK